MNNKHFIQSCLAACEAWGIIPTSFAQSMAWEEQVLWLSKFLQTQVIPVVNGHTEAIKAIEHWLDNLDLQEEVDTKLEEMAESGELTDIIAQYLDLAGVLAYKTIADMEAAENLADGSIARVLGNTNAEDGDGAYYLVRQLLNTDVIDGVQLVALTNAPTLVAERIADGNLNSAVATLNTRIDAEVAEIKNRINGLIGVTKLENTTNTHSVVYSPDGVNFYLCGDYLPEAVGEDSNSLTEINGVFYLTSNNRYWFSTDLKNWSALYNIKTGYSGRIWATTFYYDEDSEKVYAYSAYQIGDDTNSFTNDVGQTCYYFKIGVQIGEINADHSITFNQTVTDLVSAADDSFIDPFVIKDSVHGLVMAYKSEKTTKITVRTMSDLVTPTNTHTLTTDLYGIEAPQLVTDGKGHIDCYVDANLLGSTLLQGFTSLNVDGYFTVATKDGWYTAGQTGLVPIKEGYSRGFRHMGITNASKHGLECVEKLGVQNLPTFNTHGANYGINAGAAYYDCPNNAVISNTPGVINMLNNGSTYTIRCFYKDEPLKCIIRGTVTWSSDSWIASWLKNQSCTNTWQEQYVEIMPHATNLTAGVRPPVNK